MPGGATLTVARVGYIISDKNNFVRNNIKDSSSNKLLLKPDEREILFLASLAPSGHNAQPWFVKYNEPYQWTICNDKSKWLSAVDPTQRETILSMGAFIQNLEYAAGNASYNCEFNTSAKTNVDENKADVKLTKSKNRSGRYRIHLANFNNC